MSTKEIIAWFVAGALIILLIGQTMVRIGPKDWRVDYPTNFAASNYAWELLSSTDLVHWQNEPVQIDSNNVWTFQMNGRGTLFVRLQGTLSP